jgi:pimeloyl-ACP methyl ester carboxylesterase
MTDQPNRRYVTCASPSGLHRLSYVEWGDPRNPRVVVCVHGLTRTGRDFDFLARALCADYRVVCPDVAGRGESDWLKDPREYIVPAYVADMITLIARLDVESVDWVGTSLGGMIGMGIASLEKSPIRRLVLNDVGPVLSAVSLQRIADYVGKAPPFPTLELAEQYVRAVSASFGPHTDAEWSFLTQNVLKPRAEGGFRLHYDPAIALAFQAQVTGKDVDIWSIYDAIRCPTLVIRGRESDLLSEEVARAMTTRGPNAKLFELEGVGHAPTLIHADQVEAVRAFLLQS